MDDETSVGNIRLDKDPGFVNPGLQKDNVAREIDSRHLRIEIYFSRR
jgi:hypothetical protein